MGEVAGVGQEGGGGSRERAFKNAVRNPERENFIHLDDEAAPPSLPLTKLLGLTQASTDLPCVLIKGRRLGPT